MLYASDLKHVKAHIIYNLGQIWGNFSYSQLNQYFFIHDFKLRINIGENGWRRNTLPGLFLNNPLFTSVQGGNQETLTLEIFSL